jgi:hypothetical protein
VARSPGADCRRVAGGARLSGNGEIKRRLMQISAAVTPRDATAIAERENEQKCQSHRNAGAIVRRNAGRSISLKHTYGL